MIKAGVIGATGYTGLEVVRLLAHHPQVELRFATARSDAGKRLGDLHPVALDIVLAAAEEVSLGDADVLFLCLPHGASQEWAQRGLQAGCVVIDLSADHRLHEAATYAQWYGDAHKFPECLRDAVYGLTEWRRDAIRAAKLIGNPGCYPTSILLGVAPLLQAGLLAGCTVIADSKSGASGAGRTPSVGLLFAEVNENLRPYNIGHVHRHVAEMEQELSLMGGMRAPRSIVFSPHLLPVTRGIVSTIYLPLPRNGAPPTTDSKSPATDGEQHGAGFMDVRALYETAYANQPFVTVLPDGQTATLAHSVHTNRCVISLHEVPTSETLIVVSTIDNLLKGAAGQAVQNMNVRFGLEETAGLIA